MAFTPPNNNELQQQIWQNEITSSTLAAQQATNIANLQKRLDRLEQLLGFEHDASAGMGAGMSRLQIAPQHITKSRFSFSKFFTEQLGIKSNG